MITPIVPSGSIVVLDTQILIWGGLRRQITGVDLTSENVPDKQKRAAGLLSDLTLAKARVMIPTVTIAELLCPVDIAQHGNFLAALTQRFLCPPFDLPATWVAAQLWRHNRDMPKADQVARLLVKADMQIIATAKIHGARFFFTDDKGCRKLAEHAGLNAKPLPTHSLDLFADQ